MPEELPLQVAKAAAYYLGLLVLVRAAGKRMAGQTTTFDLLVLITLGVVMQTTALQQGFWNAATFIVTVFSCTGDRGGLHPLAMGPARHTWQATASRSRRTRYRTRARAGGDQPGRVVGWLTKAGL